MRCVVQVTLQDARAQETDCVSTISAPKLLISPGFLMNAVEKLQG